MKIKFDKNSWYIKLLGQPDHWCSLVWGLVWRAVALVAATVVTYWLMYLLIVGNYHVFSEDGNDGWIAGGLILDCLILYAAGAVGFIQRREIAAWMNEHCPKLEYEDE